MRKTSICGLGQVALGPVVSVLGLPRGATAARAQPRGQANGGLPQGHSSGERAAGQETGNEA